MVSLFVHGDQLSRSTDINIGAPSPFVFVVPSTGEQFIHYRFAADATAVVPSSADDAKFASNPADFDADRAPGNNDQRHRLVMSGVYTSNPTRGKLLGGWTFAAILAAATTSTACARRSIRPTARR